MPKFHVYIRQTCKGEGGAPTQNFKGFVDREGSGLVSEFHLAGAFNLKTAMELIEGYEYEQCKIQSAELKRAEVGIGLVDALVGGMCRTAFKSGVPAPCELEEIAVELRVAHSELVCAWQAGFTSFIDFINEQVASYA